MVLEEDNFLDLKNNTRFELKELRVTSMARPGTGA